MGHHEQGRTALAVELEKQLVDRLAGRAIENANGVVRKLLKNLKNVLNYLLLF